eukprot:scaffold54167_cov54-Phaeocystis_antarctica.AAC.1
MRTGHRCTLRCAKTPGSAEQTRLRRKRLFTQVASSSVQNCEVCHGSRGSLAALWAIAVECPCASARAVPAAR